MVSHTQARLMCGRWELVYLRYASLQEDVVAFLDEDGRLSGEGRGVLQHAHFS